MTRLKGQICLYLKVLLVESLSQLSGSHLILSSVCNAIKQTIANLVLCPIPACRGEDNEYVLEEIERVGGAGKR